MFCVPAVAGELGTVSVDGAGTAMLAFCSNEPLQHSSINHQQNTSPQKTTAKCINPFKGQRCQLVILCHPGLTYTFNFQHSGTLALRAERQSARLLEITNVG